MQTLSTVRAKTFFERQLAAFPFKWCRHSPLHYEVVDKGCHFYFKQKKKLFAQLYTLHIDVVFPLLAPDGKASYHFRQKRWIGEQLLVEVATSWQQAWDTVDFEQVVIVQQQGIATLTMTLIPGSYSALMIPPLKQGIPLLTYEIELITSVIEHLSGREIYASN